MTANVTSALDLATQGRAIVEQRGGKWSQVQGMCRCPAHDDRSPSLSVRVGDTSLLFHCFAGCTAINVLHALRRGGQTVRNSGSGEKNRRITFNAQPIVDRLWLQGKTLARSLADDYLATRGVRTDSVQLRFHPRVQLGKSAEATFHPALLAAVRDDAGLVAVHRTFLDPAGGTARFDNPKRCLGLPGRGAVRIGQPGRVLGLAEGLETALAATRIHGFPVWAVLGNERFGMVTVPRHVETVVLLADNDAGGDRAVELALASQQRPGLTIEIMTPPGGHNDWCDVLEASGGEREGQG